ncbi:MAG: Gx transporter family protein [Ruminococcaceae bacterium]|nr:Gx transporter family protein [Oscillospiraceae bacterium]
MSKKNSASTVARLSVLLCLALIMSYVEHIAAFDVGVPGVKVGFANIAVLFVLYRMGWKYALGINLCRVFLSALLFGNITSLIYGGCGALCSFALMYLLYGKNLFGVMGVSVAGAVCHNMAQLCAAAALMGSAYVFSYAPVLLIAGTVFGAVTGLICAVMLKKIPKNL